MKLPTYLVLGLGLLCSTAYAADTQKPATAPSNSGAQMQTSTMTGESFLQANKAKPGVVVLPSGLQYKVIKTGTGPKPSVNDIVTVNYEGTLINGTEFDSSYKRGEPASFPVGGVIAGWVEALQLMPVGSTWELYIPSSLAYGDQGAPPSIGPNETLVFKVELLGIKKA